CRFTQYPSRPGRLARARLGANVQRSVNAGVQYDAPARAGQPGPPPLALSRALAAPSERTAIRGVAHTVCAIWPCAVGMASEFISAWMTVRANDGQSVGASRAARPPISGSPPKRT